MTTDGISEPSGIPDDGGPATSWPAGSVDPFLEAQVARLVDLMAGRRTLVISGAGVSTDSGLPDYRGQGSTEEPSIEFDMFVADPVWQRWVWQRNHETWQAVAALQPSPAHRAIAALEAAGLVSGVATQNVDGLDAAAGTRSLWELHGSFREVECLDCGRRIARSEYAQLLDALNPGWPTDPDPAHVAILATARRAEAEASTFEVAPCPACGGVMKPAVVFFGEGLPSAMEQAMAAAQNAEVALVVGTSLVVSTGMWVTRQAWANGADVVVVNMGPTQGDSFADLVINENASLVLPEVARRLGA